jgi:3alpha(or 20beta)-hydroxysteroid dehydrogenase
MGSLDLSGRKALVTGGAQGLGEGMAKALAAAGAKVVISDLQKDAGEKVADALDSEYGAGNGFVAHDITDDAQWENAVVAANDIMGGLDILVNNAGVEITSLLTEVNADDIRKMLEVNVLGTTLGIKWGLRTMRPEGLAGQGGAIINVASVAATIAFPGIAVYSATKSAVDRLTKVAAMESGKLGYGVRVNCLYPGLVPTEMGIGLANDCAQLGLFESPEAAVGAVIALTPAGRLGEVADMADAVVFLASDEARFITGIGLPVDGGMGM